MRRNFVSSVRWLQFVVMGCVALFSVISVDAARQDWSSHFVVAEIAGRERWIAKETHPESKSAEPLWKAPVSNSHCVTALTLPAVLRACGSVATAEDIRKHHWIFTKTLTGYEVQDAGLSVDETVEYFDAVTTMQLYAATHFVRSHPDACEPNRGGTTHGVCAMAAGVEHVLASWELHHPNLRILRNAALRSYNVTTGPGMPFPEHRFDLSQQRWTKSFVVPPVVEYFANLSRTRANRVVDALVTMQAYTNAFGVGAVDKELVAAIYEVVVVPQSTPVVLPHGRLWCAFASHLSIDCTSPNIKLGIAVDQSTVSRSDDRDGGSVEVAADDILHLENDWIMALTVPGIAIRQGDAIRVCLAGTPDIATATFGLLLGGFGYDALTGDAADRLTATRNRRRRFVKQGPGADEIDDDDNDDDIDRSSIRRRRDLYFDVHMEMSPTPLAVEQGCLSQPLSVRGSDSWITGLLMKCMIIQQMPLNEQPNFRSIVDGPDLQKKYEYLAFFDSWLHDIISHNYTAPFILTRPRQDLTDPEHLTVTRATVVPRWCTEPTAENEQLSDEETRVCRFMVRVDAMIRDSRAVFRDARRRVQAGMAHLLKEIDRLTPELLELRSEAERRMLPVERVLNHEGWSCGASWCGGGVLGFDRGGSKKDSDSDP